MAQSQVTPAEQYATLAATLVDEPGVTLGAPGKRGFGATALQVRGKIFAMLVDETLVVKLPRGRVDALVEAGAGGRFVPAHGRTMKEWLTVEPAAGERWLPLAREALAFVGETAKR